MINDPAATNIHLVPPGVHSWCRCCGVLIEPQRHRRPEDHRCSKHLWSNPCAVEGCAKTRKAPDVTFTDGTTGRYLSLEYHLCNDHWRIGCPPNTPERKVIRRIWRTGKKFTWTAELHAREERIWSAIVSRARARAAGDIDMREINRAMGWDD